MNNRHNDRKKEFNVPVKLVICCVALAAVAISIAIIVSNKKSTPKVTTSVIMERINETSELTSAKMICTGLINYSDNKIPFINEDAFSMTYSASIQAGFNLDNASVKVTHNKVKLTLPDAEILNISIDEDSLNFYDNKFALFKDDSKQDVVTAMKQAKKDIEKKSEIEDLKKSAKKHTKLLFNKLFTDSIGDRKLVIEFADN